MSFFGGGGGFSQATVNNFEWYEEKTVLAGANSMTLTNIVPAGAELLIVEKNYGVVFAKTLHYTRINQVITFTSTIPEQMIFQIYCFKKV